MCPKLCPDTTERERKRTEKGGVAEGDSLGEWLFSRTNTARDRSADWVRFPAPPPFLRSSLQDRPPRCLPRAGGHRRVADRGGFGRARVASRTRKAPPDEPVCGFDHGRGSMRPGIPRPPFRPDCQRHAIARAYVNIRTQRPLRDSITAISFAAETKEL
jgi:hypothetical protein